MLTITKPYTQKLKTLISSFWIWKDKNRKMKMLSNPFTIPI